MNDNNECESKMDLAKKLIEFARKEAEKGYLTDNEILIRDAAEKAYLAIIETADALLETCGKYVEPGRKSHKERHNFLRECGFQNIDDKYHQYSDQLHGFCFYEGDCLTKEEMKRILNEIEEIIDMASTKCQ